MKVLLFITLLAPRDDIAGNGVGERQQAFSFNARRPATADAISGRDHSAPLRNQLTANSCEV
jgi:hypothetical protein